MTLLELVVALAVLGFVALILANVLRTSASGTQVVIGKANQIENIRLVHHFLRHQIETIRTVTDLIDTKRALVFSGNNRSVSFISPMRDGPLVGGVFRIRLAFEKGSLAVYRRAASQGAFELETQSKDQRFLLASGLADLQIRYFGRDGSSSPARWNPTWLGKKILPELIKISLVGQDGERWPDLVAPLVIGPSPR